MARQLQKLWNNAFFRGGALFTISSFGVSVINYFFNFFAARSLGPAGFSDITTQFSYIVIFSVPISVMTLVVIQKVASKGEEKSHFAISLETWFIERLKHWRLIIGLSLMFSLFVPQLTNLSPLTGYTLVPFIFLTFISSFYSAVLQGLGFLGWVSLLGLTTVAIKLIGPMLALAGFGGLTVILIFLLFSILFSFISAHLVMKKRIVLKKTSIQKIHKRIIHSIVNKSVIITFVSVLALTLFTNIDIIFVKKFFSSNTAGIYSSWSLFSKIITYGIGPVITVTYIFFASKHDDSSQEKILHLSLFLLLIVGLVSYFIYSHYANLLIRVLFGIKFKEASPFLAQASIFGSLYTVITFLNTYFLAKKSNLSLLLAICIPIYIVGLFLIKKTLSNIIQLDLYFSFATTCAYLIAYIYMFSYNVTHGKKKRTSSLS